jgi:hypothetical protein
MVKPAVKENLFSINQCSHQTDPLQRGILMIAK